MGHKKHMVGGFEDETILPLLLISQVTSNGTKSHRFVFCARVNQLVDKAVAAESLKGQRYYYYYYYYFRTTTTTTTAAAAATTTTTTTTSTITTATSKCACEPKKRMQQYATIL